ncbi:MAG: glycine cleavage system protein GcvH [Actinomycetales bacterium]|nr:glycine cleavage system protein GcvH [Actinomycetales bacterium]
MNPEELRYTAEHEWVRIDGDIAEVGITDFAQDALGDIVYASLPEAGVAVRAGTPCGEVESTKSVSEIYAPLDGAVTERNTALDTAPETVNDDPYGAGWLIRIRIAEPAQVTALLTAAQYAELIAK